jgi:hypothetical protein
MTNRVSALRLGVLLVGLALLTAGDARAGAAPQAFASCFTTPGTSMCWGTFTGFQNDSDPNSFAGFDTNSNYFSAHLAGQDYTCAVSSTLYPQVLAAWPQTTSFKGLFVMSWDADGVCSSLSFFNASDY